MCLANVGQISKRFQFLSTVQSEQWKNAGMIQLSLNTKLNMKLQIKMV